MSNEELLETAKEAINNLFSDLSVGPEKALENMEELGAEIETKIECLKTDVENDLENALGDEET